MNKLVVITGPTAIGKSEIAVNIAAKFDGEIIGTDSMQIYKMMDIGTGKVTTAEMHDIPHHMISIVMPDVDYSVGRYVLEARECIKEIVERGKLPILVGGTGLYINSLIFNHSFAGAPKNDEVRQALKDKADLYGIDMLYSQLCEVDPLSAEKINKNDAKRIIRALEIYEITGKPRSCLKDDIQTVYDYKMFVLNDERERLYKRIDARVDKMFQNGLIEEVKRLYKYKTCNSMLAIGYKEVVSYLDGEITLAEAIDSVKMNSRRYAKRQMTFFRGMKTEKNYVNIFDSKEIDEMYDLIGSFKEQ